MVKPPDLEIIAREAVRNAASVHDNHHAKQKNQFHLNPILLRHRRNLTSCLMSQINHPTAKPMSIVSGPAASNQTPNSPSF
jgi:hypothetical protein